MVSVLWESLNNDSSMLNNPIPAQDVVPEVPVREIRYGECARAEVLIDSRIAHTGMPYQVRPRMVPQRDRVAVGDIPGTARM